MFPKTPVFHQRQQFGLSLFGLINLAQKLAFLYSMNTKDTDMEAPIKRETNKSLSFGDRLTKAMINVGHTKNASLAAEIGVSESTICRWKCGSAIKLKHIIKLKNALSVSLDWLICGEGDMAGEQPRLKYLITTKLSEKSALEVISFLNEHINSNKS